LFLIILMSNLCMFVFWSQPLWLLYSNKCVDWGVQSRCNTSDWSSIMHTRTAVVMFHIPRPWTREPGRGHLDHREAGLTKSSWIPCPFNYLDCHKSSIDIIAIVFLLSTRWTEFIYLVHDSLAWLIFQWCEATIWGWTTQIGFFTKLRMKYRILDFIWIVVAKVPYR